MPISQVSQVVRSPERLPLPFPFTDYSCARVRDNMNGYMTQVSETIKEKQMNVDALATAYTLHCQTILNLVQHQIWLRHPRNVDVTVNDQGEQFTKQNKLSHPLHKHTTCFNTLRLKTHYLYQRPLHLKHSHIPHTITATDIKTNVRHINTSIVSRHLATRSNNKILRTPLPHISISEQILPRLTRHNIAQLRTNKSPFLKSYLQKSTPNHIHQHYAPSLTHTRHTSSLQLLPHTHHIVTPGFVDKPHRSDCTSGLMDGEACW